MPHIAVTMYPGRDDGLKKKLALELKKTIVDVLGADPKVVSVSVQDVAPEKWAENVAAFPAETVFMPAGEELPEK